MVFNEWTTGNWDRLYVNGTTERRNEVNYCGPQSDEPLSDFHQQLLRKFYTKVGKVDMWKYEGSIFNKAMYDEITK